MGSGGDITGGGAMGGMPGGGAGGSGDMTGGGADANCGDDMPGGTGGIAGGDPSAACGGAGGVGQYPGESAAERKARLEGTLEDSVGGFDEVLAEEQREISTVGRNTEGFGGGQGGGGRGVGLGKQATGGVRGSGEVADTGTAGGGGGPSPSVSGMSEADRKARTPDDIPDLVSEDIVAKQLREAAQSEEDPQLRERLWEEYRNYNNL